MANLFDDLSEKIADVFTNHLPPLKEDAKKQCRAVLTATLGKCNLVTREEFDAQAAVLARTRSKLEALETQLAEWEKTQK